MEIVGLLAGLLLGLVLGACGGWLWARSRPEVYAAVRDAAADQAQLLRGLDRLSDQMQELDRSRALWQGQLDQQVQDMRSSTDLLRRETLTLSTALRRPQVRGRWGELHLRRTVEVAGLVDRCDFTVQARLDDGRLRPDLVVHLAQGRSVVVDSKVPLDAFLEATGTDDDELRTHHLVRHARQLRTHIDQLGSKAYWRELAETPEFVVLFVPAEAFLSAALEHAPDLIEYAAAKDVVLASPTTLIGLLRTVAHGWRHQALADQARVIQQLGRELHERLGTMGSHFTALGRALDRAVVSYNSAVGSLESRVLVSARKFTDLGVTTAELDSPPTIDTTTRDLAAWEEGRTLRRAADTADGDGSTVAS